MASEWVTGDMAFDSPVLRRLCCDRGLCSNADYLNTDSLSLRKGWNSRGEETHHIQMIPFLGRFDSYRDILRCFSGGAHRCNERWGHGHQHVADVIDPPSDDLACIQCCEERVGIDLIIQR